MELLVIDPENNTRLKIIAVVDRMKLIEQEHRSPRDVVWESSRTSGVSLALNYVSHFDVFRQHVTRIFTSDTDALEGGGEPGANAHAHARMPA